MTHRLLDIYVYNVNGAMNAFFVTDHSSSKTVQFLTTLYYMYRIFLSSFSFGMCVV